MIAMLRRAFKVRAYVSPIQADGLFSDGWTTYTANAFQAFRHDWRSANLRVAVFNFWMTVKD